jgi:hypothetical protein
MALTGKGKGRVHPKTGDEGTEWEYRYSSTLSLTSAVDRGEYSTPRHAPAALPREGDPVPIVHAAGWDSGPVWTGAENLASTGIWSSP